MKLTLAPKENTAFWGKFLTIEKSAVWKWHGRLPFGGCEPLTGNPGRDKTLGILLSSLLLWCFYFHSPARRGRGTPPTKIVFLGSKGWEPSITKSLSLRFHGRICTWKKVVYLVLTSFPSTPNENKMTQDKPNVCAFYNIQVPTKIKLIT